LFWLYVGSKNEFSKFQYRYDYDTGTIPALMSALPVFSYKVKCAYRCRRIASIQDCHTQHYINIRRNCNKSSIALFFFFKCLERLFLGLILLDIWWMERSIGSIPESLDLLDIADAGINLSVLILVSRRFVQL
jgi:hypothetical protein